MSSSIVKKILVTGASGFIGQRLVQKLVETGLSVFAVSRKEGLVIPGATVLHGDISDSEFTKSIIGDVDTVYYLAGEKKNLSHHREYAGDFVMGNVSPLLSFLTALRGASVRKIVYLSSTQTIGRDWETETDGYSIGKYMNELLLRSFAAQWNIELAIIRAPGVYGPGDNFDPATANFIPSMVHKVLSGNEVLDVWGGGKREMQFVFVDDIAAMLASAGEGSTQGTIVVGNPETFSVNDIAQEIISLSGKKMRIVNDMTKPDQPSQLFLFINPIEPKISLQDGLRKTIAYYHEHHA
ncbi:MAG: 4-ketoreductase [Parcubacteria group bacterium GW2011_GWA2_47_7]|nr:MAG: 4-ketoreductase [Parcubacteria group bacterium GW2011_GWA2_47_7]